MTTAASAQNIEIISVEEKGNSVEIAIETDMATPFEVMAGVGLSGQAGEDVFIGNSVRQTVTSATQMLIVPAIQEGDALPSGEYEAEVNFYPRWGAENSPASTQAISTEVQATQPFTIAGSGAPASEILDRNNLQRWVMLNTGAGDSFDLDALRRRLGESEAMDVPNRNHLIKAHHFPGADMTLFEDTLHGTLVTWKLGRTNQL
jgi:hypothetical protein